MTRFYGLVGLRLRLDVAGLKSLQLHLLALARSPGVAYMLLGDG